MPIYTYRLKQGGHTFEALRDALLPEPTTLGDIDEEAIVSKFNPYLEWEVEDEIERVPSAPGGFRGLPTPKFHS